VYDENSVRVYFAMPNRIADSLLGAQKLVAPFSFTKKATWIKPSFLWTMKRTKWGEYSRIGKHGTRGENRNDATVIGLLIERDGFEELLRRCVVINHEDHSEIELHIWQRILEAADGFVQWDPEKDFHGNRQPYRAIQIGLKPTALPILNEAIVRMDAMTGLIRKIVDSQVIEGKIELLPDERPYPVSAELYMHLHMRDVK